MAIVSVPEEEAPGAAAGSRCATGAGAFSADRPATSDTDWEVTSWVGTAAGLSSAAPQARIRSKTKLKDPKSHALILGIRG